MSASAARVARRVRAVHLQSLSTLAEPAPQSQASRERRPRTWKPEENLRSMHPRMIFVRPWDGIPTMAHAFALIREIERRFGKIQEFVVLRDSDVTTNNLPYMHATFARAEYADAIPLEGRVIQVPLPSVDPHREGGVGLDDLEDYLDAGIRAEKLSKGVGDGEIRDPGPQDSSIMTDVKLERTGMRESPPALDIVLGHKSRFSGPPILRRPDRVEELADAILSFGGFASAPRDILDRRKQKTRMQLVMERWSQKTSGKANAVLAEPANDEVSSGEPMPFDVLPTKPIPWQPFTHAGSPAEAETTPLSSAPQPSESVPSSPPPLPPAFDTPSKPKATAPTSPIPKISKKKRLLLAVRSRATSQPAENDYGKLEEHPEHPGPTLKLDQEDLGKRDKDNNRAARKWWDFLNGNRE